MQTEIEAKFTNIDTEVIRTRLRSLGAKLMQAERLMRRRNFDFPDSRLYKVGAWVRVRDEGDKVTMSYKHVQDRSLHGTKEASVSVSNFDDACAVLESIGLEAKSYQETRRESWELDGVQIELDTWPWIPSFVELEGESESVLKETAQKLGLNWAEAMHGSVETAYQAVYDVTEEEIDGWEEIKFIPVPDWLEAKRKSTL